MAAKRRRWHNRQTWLNPERLVFIDENPIEQAFAKLKVFLRKAAARTAR